MSASASTLPTELYSSLLLKIVTVLELTQSPEGTATLQAKQAILQATNDFKNAINQAKEAATNLPGGEMLVGEQEDVIAMLEKLRDRKSEKLAQFASLPLVATSQSTDNKMEIDSTASTPYND